MKFEISLFVTVLLCSSTVYCEDSECVKKSPCSCQFSNGSVIDLTIIGLKNGSARFHDEFAKDLKYSYSYNPCFNFKAGNASDPASCGAGVAACQFDNTYKRYYNVGNQKTAKFMTNGSVVYISYTTNQGRITNVTLLCDRTLEGLGKLEVIGEVRPTHYEFNLRSRCACVDECLEEKSNDVGLSTGSVLVILLFVFSFCYLIGGIIFQKIIKGATGNELIPNYDFWIDFPLLVRDGAIFFMSGFQNTASYDQI